MYISGLRLMLAEETRPDVIARMIDNLKRGAVKYYIPYTHVRKGTSGSASQTITNKLSSAHGMYLRSWVHVVMPDAETLNRAFDNSNTGTAAVTDFKGGPLSDDTSKVVLYYHNIDNKMVEPFMLRPTAKSKQDYMIARNSLRGSLISNPEQFSNPLKHYDFLTTTRILVVSEAGLSLSNS
jgi:hypothetical protein